MAKKKKITTKDIGIVVNGAIAIMAAIWLGWNAGDVILFYLVQSFVVSIVGYVRSRTATHFTTDGVVVNGKKIPGSEQGKDVALGLYKKIIIISALVYLFLLPFAYAFGSPSIIVFILSIAGLVIDQVQKKKASAGSAINITNQVGLAIVKMSLAMFVVIGAIIASEYMAGLVVVIIIKTGIELGVQKLKRST